MIRTPVAFRAVTAIAAAALAVWCALFCVSAAYATDVPEAPARAALTEANQGDIIVALEGSRATVTTDLERAYVYVYDGDDEPVGVGWQEPVDGSFDVDVSLMPAGEIAVALLGSDAEVIGWGSAGLAAEHSYTPPAEAPTGSNAAVWWWIGGAVVLVGAATAIVLVRRKRRPPEAAQ